MFLAEIGAIHETHLGKIEGRITNLDAVGAASDIAQAWATMSDAEKPCKNTVALDNLLRDMAGLPPR